MTQQDGIDLFLLDSPWQVEPQSLERVLGTTRGEAWKVMRGRTGLGPWDWRKNAVVGHLMMAQCSEIK